MAALAELVPDGAIVAVGGTWLSARPMAAVRELIRAKRRRLTVISLTGSLDVDLLVGCGAADRVVFSFVSLGPFGLAPRFRAAAEMGTIILEEHSGHGLTTALEAASRALDHLPFHGPVGTSLAGRYPVAASPATGKGHEVAAAQHVDVALVHAEAATPDGHVLLAAANGMDMVTARAAHHVVVTTERIVDRLPAAAGGRYLAPVEVHTLIEAPWGAHPLSLAPAYGLDWRQLLEYADAAIDEAGFTDWLTGDLADDERSRRNQLDAAHRRRLRAVGCGGPSRAPATPRLERGPSGRDPATPTERIVVELAERLSDGDTAVLGSFTPIGYAAVLLAARTHAPMLDFNAYGYGGTMIGWLGHLGVEGRACTTGHGPLAFHELVGSLRFRGSLAFEPVRPAQVDGSGALNLRWLHTASGSSVRLPGTAGASEVIEMHRRPVGYLPRHDRRSCVEKVEDASLRIHLPHGQRDAFRLVTDLAVLDFGADGWHVVSRHPGVGPDRLAAATGFPLLGLESSPVTAEPARDVLELLREEIDPLGLTELESHGGAARRDRLQTSLALEETMLLAEE